MSPLQDHLTRSGPYDREVGGRKAEDTDDGSYHRPKL
jgi:hypothetical protein